MTTNPRHAHTIATPDDALTAALAISDLILADSDGTLESDYAREKYGSLRELLITHKISPDTREGKLISNMIEIADDHFDF